MSNNEIEGDRPTADPTFYDLRLVATAVLRDPDPTEYVTHVHGQILLDPEDDAADDDGSPPGGPDDTDDPLVDDDADDGGAAENREDHEDGVRVCRGKVVAGRLALTVYDLDRARDDREDPFCVFDAVSQDALDLYGLLYDGRDEDGDGFGLRPHVAAAAAGGVAAAEPYRPSLVVVEAVELLPRFRGRGLGLAAALRALYLAGPAGGLAAVLAAPLCAWPRLDGYDEHDPDGGDAGRWRRRLAVDRFPADSPAVRAKLGEYWGRLGFRPVGGDWYVRGLAAAPLPRVADVLANLRGGRGGTGNGTSAT